MYDTTEKSEQTAKNIVKNLNDIATTAKSRKGKEYIKTGRPSIKMPEVDSNVGSKLEEFADKQVKRIGSTTKKVKKNVVDID
jgi:hypothetical protein